MVFLSAEWRDLAILNYEIDPAVLRPLVPRGVELDDRDGRTLCSMVGFLFLRTRVLGLPIPFHRNFEEINLRFYVRRKSGGEWRRGVVFVKEIVPRFAIAAVARGLYDENYVAFPTRSRVGRVGSAEPREVEYGWKFGGRWNSLSLKSEGGDPRPLVAGSEAEFIAEHYWGYTARRDGGASEYRVEHPPWRVWNATDAKLDCDAAALYGPRFAETLAAPPRSAFLAEGSPIAVRFGGRIA